MAEHKEAKERQVDVFLRALRVNVMGGALWAVLMTVIRSMQAEPDLSVWDIVLLLISGAVSGGMLSIGGFLIPRIRRGGEVSCLIYDFLCGLTSIYTTILIIFSLAASAIVLSGGAFPIRGDYGTLSFLQMGDLLGSLSPEYLLKLAAIPLLGAPLSLLIDLAKPRVYTCLRVNRFSAKTGEK